MNKHFKIPLLLFACLLASCGTNFVPFDVGEEISYATFNDLFVGHSKPSIYDHGKIIQRWDSKEISYNGSISEDEQKTLEKFLEAMYEVEGYVFGEDIESYLDVDDVDEYYFDSNRITYIHDYKTSVKFYKHNETNRLSLSFVDKQEDSEYKYVHTLNDNGYTYELYRYETRVGEYTTSASKKVEYKVIYGVHSTLEYVLK